MKKLVLLFVTLILVSYGLSANAGKTNSEKFAWLENASEARETWIRSQNSAFSTYLSTKSHNYKAVRSDLYKKLDIEENLGSFELKSGIKLSVKKLGLGKDTHIYLKQPDENERIIFKQSSMNESSSYRFLYFNPSSLEGYVQLVFSKGGAFDETTLMFYDVKNQKVLPDIFHVKYSMWVDNTSFVYAHKRMLESEKDNCRLYNLLSKQTSLYECPEKWVGAYSPTFEVRTAQMTLGQYLYKAEQISSIQSKIIRVDQNSSDQETTVQTLPGLIKDLAKISVDLYYANLITLQGQKILIINSTTNKIVSELLPPDGTRISSLGGPYPEAEDIIHVSFKSFFHHSMDARYSLAEKRFLDLKVIDQLQSIDGVSFQTEHFIATSFDGTKIPYQITYRKGLVKNGKLPIFFETYAGMGGEDYFLPYTTLNANVLEFLKRGGVFLGAAPRGSSDFGLQWYNLGRLANKKNTFADVAAVAEDVVAKGMTEAGKIILYGHSNGGLTTAATGLLYPGRFGLVIADNGVYDMLARERLDENFSGYPSEWGSAADPQFNSYLRSYSPVELASGEIGNNFLLINGRTDTRVMAIHSFKLKAAFNEASNPKGHFVLFASLPNGGHLVSQRGGDLQTWRAQSMMWSLIYDTLGLVY